MKRARRVLVNGSRDISKLPIMPSKCATCPFRDDNNNGVWEDRSLRTRIEQQVLSEASQTCHHSGGLGKEDTHVCRGARDFQLQFFYRIGFLDAPTDEAWAAKRRELGMM